MCTGAGGEAAGALSHVGQGPAPSLVTAAWEAGCLGRRYMLRVKLPHPLCPRLRQSTRESGLTQVAN